MAKTELKVLDKDFDFIKISTYAYKNDIKIKIELDKSFTQITLDKSSAIKFAKTLRTEINKITESEVDNG